MNIGELKAKLDNFPNDYPIVLLDLTTDDELVSCYKITSKDIGIINLYDYPDKEKEHKGICISFENRLNENPI